MGADTSAPPCNRSQIERQQYSGTRVSSHSLLFVGTLRRCWLLACCRRSIHGQFFDADFLAILKGVGRVKNNPILERETLQDLKTRPIVTAVRNLPQIERVIRIDHDSPKPLDRKSTRLNSSHITISYAVFCLKK